ncbi:MAG: GTPase HflX [bacterium]
MEGYKINNSHIYNNDHLLEIQETAILIGQEEESMNELEKLTKTAGVKVKTSLLFRGDRINASFYIGTGKLQELKSIIEHHDINVVIFDNELSPAQFRNLEEELDVKVIDRTQLILDIFALHAQSKESKIQVELVQLEYMLPKLKGSGRNSSRLGAGIGTRGPGESKLEIDRRRIQNKISKLKLDLKDIKKNRVLQRKNRNDPMIALIGYTNAGKSTLMNTLTNANTLVADQLFATLDSTLRSTTLPFGKKVIFTDTIGFINKLPHELIASFSATLEEARKADILIHVVDASSENIEKHINVVNDILKEMEIKNKDIILLFNKKDKISTEKITEYSIQYPNALFISSLNKKGIDNLFSKISELILKNMYYVELKLPYSKANIVNIIHENGEMIVEEYLKDAIFIKAKVNKKIANKLQQYIV